MTLLNATTSIPASAGLPPVRQPVVPRCGMASELSRVAQSASSLMAALSGIAPLLRESAGCELLVAIRGVSGRGALKLERATQDTPELPPVEQAELLMLAQRAVAQGTGLSVASLHGSRRPLCAVPFATATALEPADAENDCVALAAAGHPNPEFPHRQSDLLTSLELLAVALAVPRKDALNSKDDARGAAALVELMTRSLSSHDFGHAASQLAAGVCEFLDARSAWIATRPEGGDCEVVGTAGATPVATSDEYAAMAAALNEAVVRDRLTVWPAIDPSERWGCLSHQRAKELSGAEALVSAPIRNSEGRVIGAVLVAGSREKLTHPPSLAWLRAAESPLSVALEASRRANLSAWQRLSERATPAGGWWTRRNALFATIAAAVLMAVPAPHRIACECEVQPVARRYVTAPFDGRLEHGMVKPGDTVATGQLLARMDGREIELERAAVEADLHRAVKRRDGELAEHDFGAAHLSGFEADRLRARSELLRSRGGQLEIRSPVDGIVISGDLERVDGSALKLGQSLYEIAPLDRMTVEVAVPADDVAFVRAGMPLRVRLEGSRSAPLEGRLERIHPRSEIRNDQNVFIGEIQVENPAGELRPGARGTARLHAGWKPLGWIWLHKAWDRAIAWMGW